MENTTQERVDDYFNRRQPKKQSLLSTLKSRMAGYRYRRFALNRFPLFKVLYNYDVKSCILNDLLAGLSVGLSTIPQAMGCALMLRVPVQYGLYSIIFPSLIYSFMTTSVHSTCTINIEGTIFMNDALQTLGYNDNLEGSNSSSQDGVLSTDIEERLDAIFALSFISGVLILVATLCKLGIFVQFNSEPHISAIFAASGIAIVINQIPPMLGIVPDTHVGFLQTFKLFINICQLIPESNIASAIISFVSLIVIIIVKEGINSKFSARLPVPIPIEMIVLLSTTAMSAIWNWEESLDIKITGFIPTGFPAPQLPLKSDWTKFIKEGTKIAMLTYLGVPIVIKYFATRHNYQVNTDQEMGALGTSQALTAPFSCMALSVSAPRIFIMESCQGKTQVSYIIAAMTSMIVLIFLASHAETLPKCVVAAIIVSAFFRVYDSFMRVRKYWRRDKIFFIIWMVSFLVSLLFTISDGYLYGLLFSIIVAALRTMLTKITLMNIGHFNNKTYLLTKKKYGFVNEGPSNVKIIAVNGAMFYCNSNEIKIQILKHFSKPSNLHLSQNSPMSKASIMKRPRSASISFINEGYHYDEPPYVKPSAWPGETCDEVINAATFNHVGVNVLILDFSGVPFIDTSALRELLSLRNELWESHKVRLCICECREEVRDVFFKAPSVLNTLKPCMYASVLDAIDCSLRSSDVRPDDSTESTQVSLADDFLEDNDNMVMPA